MSEASGSTDEQPVVAPMRTTGVTATGICEQQCVAGDVTISVTFTRPVPVDQPLGCPLCGAPLRIIKTPDQWAVEVGHDYPFSSVREAWEVYSKHPRPWRTGRKVGRTLYDATPAPGGAGGEDGRLIGVMDSPELAAAVADAVNAQEGGDVR